MALRRTVPLRYSPVGLSDSLDATDDFPGAMAGLGNLIPDPSTKNIWQCRPASLLLYSFADFSTPTTISALRVIGTKAYGMIASALNPGYDEPFCYDLRAGSFIAFTGVTGANVPATQSSSGAWTPPIMDVIGTKLIVCHPGFNPSGGTYFGVMDISNPAAPTWTATNTSPTALPSVPVAVAQFNDRAWFICNPATGNPAAYFSDALAATTITAGTQIVTFGDNVPLTMAAGLGLNTQLTGGVVQSLIVFKGVTGMYQITGDPTTNNLERDSIAVATGTLAPLSVCNTTNGLAFMAPDGFRVLGFDSNVSPPIGVAGSGVTLPFSYTSVPSRVCAAFNAGVLRASTQNAYLAGAPSYEYWCHFDREMRWSGPHNFPASNIQPYLGSFILAAKGVNAKLFQSDIAQTATSGFVENGVQMTYNFQTSMLPDPQQMAEMELTETTVNIGWVSGLPNITVTAVDQDGGIYDTVTLSIPGGATAWGGFTWGVGTWGGSASALAPRPINWHIPIVFRRLFLQLMGNSAANVRLGDIFMRYRILKYLQQVTG